MSAPFGEFNLEATFLERKRAEEAVDRLRRDLRARVTIDRADTGAALRAEMRDEVEATVAGAGNVGPFTKGMTRGLAIWLPVGTVAGIVLGLLIGLTPWGAGAPLVFRLIVGAVIGLFAGATVGFVAGGFVRSRQEGEGGSLPAERGTVVGVHADTADEIERAERIVGTLGAERVARVDRHGTPLGRGPRERTRPVRGDVPATPEDDG
ncbi:MAG TPA: hypothetical protein VHL78_03985 [Actinomycetota bacterium]|nr:hypothetical protein [Actinomycetota bacterium]